MTTTYDISGSVNIGVALANTRTDNVGEIDGGVNIYAPFGFTYGSGASQINQLYRDSITLADGANTTLNLKDSGTLKDAFGNALVLSAVKCIFIRNNSADANLLIGGGNSADIPIFSNAAHQLIIKPGGVFPWFDLSAAGTVISTNKNLRLAHDGTGTSSMIVDVIVGGIQ